MIKGFFTDIEWIYEVLNIALDEINKNWFHSISVWALIYNSLEWSPIRYGYFIESVNNGYEFWMTDITTWKTSNPTLYYYENFILNNLSDFDGLYAMNSWFSYDFPWEIAETDAKWYKSFNEVYAVYWIYDKKELLRLKSAFEKEYKKELSGVKKSASKWTFKTFENPVLIQNIEIHGVIRWKKEILDLFFNWYMPSSDDLEYNSHSAKINGSILDFNNEIINLSDTGYLNNTNFIIYTYKKGSTWLSYNGLLMLDLYDFVDSEFSSLSKDEQNILNDLTK